MRLCLMLLPLATLLSAAPGKDFLTADEIDQVRLAQDPNDRLKLYTQFARQRVELIKQIAVRQKPGSAGLMQDTIEEYSQIIDAIDTVTDEALQRKLDVKEGIKAVTDAEKEFVPQLRKVEESKPKDLSRYQFALAQAIETTQDSLDLANEDLRKRSSEVAEREQREKKELESMMQPKDLEGKKAEEKKQAADQKKGKPPTLLRKGETVKQQ
jgi:hypothetical protein